MSELVHKIYGTKFPKSKMFTERICNAIRLGRYEAHEAKAALSNISAGDRVLELGGGAGFMSTLITQKIAVASYTLVEADYRMLPVIRQMHALNDVAGVTVHHAIASATDGAVGQFALAGNFTASSANRLGVGRREVEVPKISVRSLTDDGVDVLICDIEGGELDVLPSCDLASVRAVIAELHPDVIGSDGVLQVFGAMHGQGLVYDCASSFGNVVTFKRGQVREQ